MVCDTRFVEIWWVDVIVCRHHLRSKFWVLLNATSNTLNLVNFKLENGSWSV
jgi:hypothetical protein